MEFDTYVGKNAQKQAIVHGTSAVLSPAPSPFKPVEAGLPTALSSSVEGKKYSLVSNPSTQSQTVPRWRLWVSWTNIFLTGSIKIFTMTMWYTVYGKKRFYL